MFERILRIINEDYFNKIQNVNVLLIGIGGVGGYALESLIRTGFIHITIIDYDNIEISNLNRQIITNQNNISKSKVKIAKNRALEINPKACILDLQKKLEANDITLDFLKEYDYIIDACDNTLVKAKLIEVCTKNKIKLISCMGTGNRTHPELLEITTLEKTQGDPLARKIRNLVKINKKFLKANVIWSKELPIKNKKLGTICSVPMAAGSLLASYVVNDLIKTKKIDNNITF